MRNVLKFNLEKVFSSEILHINLRVRKFFFRFKCKLDYAKRKLFTKKYILFFSPFLWVKCLRKLLFRFLLLFFLIQLYIVSKNALTAINTLTDVFFYIKSLWKSCCVEYNNKFVNFYWSKIYNLIPNHKFEIFVHVHVIIKKIFFFIHDLCGHV